MKPIQPVPDPRLMFSSAHDGGGAEGAGSVVTPAMIDASAVRTR